MVNSVLSAGLQCVQSGINTSREAAADIAQAATLDPTAEQGVEPDSGANSEPVAGGALADITEAIVQLKVGEHQVKASAEVIRTADEILGTIVDITA